MDRVARILQQVVDTDNVGIMPSWRLNPLLSSLRGGSVHGYNSLFTSLYRLGYPDKALKMWEQMRREDVAPNTMTFNVVANCYLKEGDLQSAVGLLTYIKKYGLSPDASTFATLLKGCLQSGEEPKARALLADMKSSGVRVDAASEIEHLLDTGAGTENALKAVEQLLSDSLHAALEYEESPADEQDEARKVAAAL